MNEELGMSDVAAIVAVDERWAIGRGGGLLCHLPADLRHFKQLTLGHTVVMGRRTFESLPGGPLPGRENIVVSRQHDYAPAGVTVAHSLDEALATASMPEPVFIIGGAQLYAAAMPFVNRLYLTVIGHAFDDADTFFPSIDITQWTVVEREAHDADERNAFPYVFLTLSRIES